MKKDITGVNALFHGQQQCKKKKKVKSWILSETGEKGQKLIGWNIKGV